MQRIVLEALVLVVLAQAGLAVTAQQHHHMAAAAAPPAGGAEAGPAGMRAAAPSSAQDGCVTAPTMANCSQYNYPQAAAAADLGKLCHAMSFMGACSVAQACNASGANPDVNPRAPGAANVSRNIPNVCEPFQLVTTVCRLDTGMSKMSGVCRCWGPPACVLQSSHGCLKQQAAYTERRGN